MLCSWHAVNSVISVALMMITGVLRIGHLKESEVFRKGMQSVGYTKHCETIDTCMGVNTCPEARRD